jgi:signal peptidase I
MALAVVLAGQGVVAVNRRFVVEGFRLPSEKMAPSLIAGDSVLVTKLSASVQRGDVVVYRHPGPQGALFVKRVVAVEGDNVALDDEAGILLEGVPLRNASFDGPCPVSGRQCRSFTETFGERSFDVVIDRTRWRAPFGPISVPQGHVFVMSDDRDGDVPREGTIAASELVGRATIVFFSSDDTGWPRWERLGTPVE